MVQPSQANLPGASINTNEIPISISPVSDGLLPAQKAASAESVALDFTGKEADGVDLGELRNSLDRDAGRETEYLLKLVASLESCNTALLIKLNQAERELVARRQSSVQTLPEMEPINGSEQSYGWERKLTRTRWRPT